MPDLYSPAGTKIVASLEIVQVEAKINSFDPDGNPQYSGETEVLWDTQTTVTEDPGDCKGPQEVYLDANGDQWRFDQCTLR